MEGLICVYGTRYYEDRPVPASIKALQLIYSQSFLFMAVQRGSYPSWNVLPSISNSSENTCVSKSLSSSTHMKINRPFAVDVYLLSCSVDYLQECVLVVGVFFQQLGCQDRPS
jgi:hypothetical protein